MDHRHRINSVLVLRTSHDAAEGLEEALETYGAHCGDMCVLIIENRDLNDVPASLPYLGSLIDKTGAYEIACDGHIRIVICDDQINQDPAKVRAYLECVERSIGAIKAHEPHAHEEEPPAKHIESESEPLGLSGAPGMSGEPSGPPTGTAAAAASIVENAPPAAATPPPEPAAAPAKHEHAKGKHKH